MNRNPNLMAEQLLDEQELAELLRLSPVTLRCWRARGKGPRFMKIAGWSVRYRWTDVEEWLKQAEQGGGRDDR